MVIAGPGTGKTQILAHRIAQILQETDSAAHNILCLTYTEAGTIAMRQRLVSLIGSEGHRVAIHTFHSFCNKVIQENLEYFNYRDLEPITELEKIELITSLATELSEDHPLKKMKGNVRHLVSSFSALFDWMKSENIQPSWVDDQINQKKQSILESEDYRYKRAYKEFKKGDIKQNQVDIAFKKLDDLSAAAQLYPNYCSKLEQAKRYDYADMILWAIELFSTNESVLRNYQEIYQYVLVDEYQDTSGSQNAVLRALINYWENPNVFVVGDDDQSIYKFQGAEIKNVLGFLTDFSQHLTPIVLDFNYRSTQKILNVSRALIENNSERLINYIPHLEKNLQAQRQDLDRETPVRIAQFDHPVHEALWIHQEIKNLLARGAQPSDIAILYAKHKHADVIGKILHEENVPVYYKRAENVLESIPVKQILSVVQFLVMELNQSFSGGTDLFEILHYPGIGIKPIHTAQLSRYVGSPENRDLTLRALISDEELLSKVKFLNDETTAHICNVSTDLENLISRTAVQSTYQTIYDIVDFLKLTGEAFQTNQYGFTLECISSFLDFVESESNKGLSSLEELLTKVQLLDSHHIRIPKDRIVYEEKGVQLITAHSSKGLEFKHVFVLQCAQNAWEKERSFNHSFNWKQISDSTKSDDGIEEKRRLFYVAMTRAEQSLTLSYSTTSGNDKEVSRSQFIDEIENHPGVAFLKPAIGSQVSANRLAQLLSKPKSHEINLIDESSLDSFLANYKLSASHLNQYIECPTAFYFKYVLRVPARKNVYMSFGIAVHKALELTISKREDPEFFNARTMSKIYSSQLDKHRAVYSEQEFKDFQSLGQNILGRFFEARKNEWSTTDTIKTELDIDQVEINGVPIKGKLDLVEIDEMSARVVDFKTGDPKNAKSKMKPPKADATTQDSIIAQYGGSYWRQIMFYALLVNYDKTSALKMRSGSMDFVEPSEDETFINYEVFIDQDGLETITQMVEWAYEQIMTKQFSHGCMEDTCEWCQFTTNYYK